MRPLPAKAAEPVRTSAEKRKPGVLAGLPLPARPPSWVRKGIAWILDYAYVGYWQVAGFLFRRDPAPYLDTPEVTAGKVGPEPGADGGESARSAAAPVLLIPGIYETWQFMRPVADKVHELGHPVHVVTAMGYNRGRIADMAALVGSYLEEHDLRDVVLVAHSKGGLIGKCVMTMPGPGSRVARMVAVNTPFSGSVYANFFLLPSIRAFSPQDKFLRSLLQHVDVNSRITSVYGSFDPHIPGGSHLSGAANVRLETMGHFRPLSDPRLLDAVAAALAGEPDGPRQAG